MPAASSDPRSYVKCIPVPTPNHKGVKIQARSATIYNATVPTRDEIRRDNYIRRQRQLTSQGFHSPIHLPYKGIGEPVYLEEKALILHAVGQLQEGVDWEDGHYSDGEKKDVEKQFKTERPEPKSLAATKMMILRSNKKLITLNKAISHGRNLVRNVSLGRGLFEMIKENELAKKKALEDEERERIERAKLQWRNPMYDSSSSDNSDMESESEAGSPLSFQHSSSVTPANDVIVSADIQDGITAQTPHQTRITHSSEQYSVQPTVVVSRSCKKKISPTRPYTPQHNNISHCSTNINSDSLFRQLCALHWLLEVTSADSNQCMTHIHSCWNLEEIGGARIFSKRFQRQRWDSFIGATNSSMAFHKQPFGRKHYGGMTRRSSSRRSSFTTGLSTCTTPTLQSREVGSPSGQIECIPAEDFLEMLNEDNESTQYSLPGLQDNIEENLKLKSAKSTMETLTSTKENSKSKIPEQLERKKSKQNNHSDSQDLVAGLLMEEPSLKKHSKVNQRRLRPKSSPVFIAQPERESLITVLRQRFDEVKEDKAFTLHDCLDKMDKEHLFVCQSKYRAISVGHFSYHRALDKMRGKTSALLNKPDKKITPDSTNWFTELEANIPSTLKSIWYYETILRKLANFGSMQSGGKLSAYKFLKVLSSLESWDICNPDISAAIEFCRAKIMDITIEEYEGWFRQQFPAVYRPETAPARSKPKFGKASYRNSTSNTQRTM